MGGNHRFIHLLPFFCLHYLLLISEAARTNISTDQSALLALKNHVTSDPYGVLEENWTLSTSVCNWIGVTCGALHHRVTALNISNMGLTGDIPPEFGNLSFLTSLDMRWNHFSGILPDDMIRLRRLRFMRLSDNLFTGEVPFWLLFMPQLQLLTLRNNSFTGFSPFHQSFTIINETKLETLVLSFNSLQGQLPEYIGNLHNLIFISLEMNQLTGSIPFGIFNISTLTVMAFSNNKLSGILPDDICSRLPLLQGLYLSDNEIMGQIPSNISFCPRLQTLSLSNNKIGGIIPPGIVNLEMLETLYLGFNQLIGSIPSDIGKLWNLQYLGLEGNHLTGSIPSSLFNISSLLRLSFEKNHLQGSLTENYSNLTILMELYLGHNNFTGVIPQSLSELKELSVLSLGANLLSGSVPSGIFNSSSLTIISMTGNNLSGKLTSEFGYFLPILEILYLGDNNFDGVIPNSIANSSELKLLDLSGNELSGSIPNSLGNLRALQVLNLQRNKFTGDVNVQDLSFITNLVNCRYLTELSISYNPLNGILPISVGNLSSSLHTIYASDCEIKGNIPDEIGNLSGLVSLYLYGNNLTGLIPETLDGLWRLQRLSLGGNKLRGFIPIGLCKLMNLGALYLSDNQLSGSIPECLGNVSSLRNMNLDFNNLTSDIPASIWNLKDLLELDISSNSLAGSLSPGIGNLEAATTINLSMNQLSNEIPTTIRGLKSLTELSLSHNSFQGSIPESMGEMLNLVTLDLSHNKLSGEIPKSLESLTHLLYFDASFNALAGEIPNGGPFKNFTNKSFMSNGALCGPPRFQVSSCPASRHPSKSNKVLRAIFISLGIAILLAVITSTLIVLKCRRKTKTPPDVSDLSPTGRPTRFSYYDLLQATNGYGESNFIGRGSFGSVYKGVLRDETILAIKVFNMNLEGALKSFDDECEALRNLRHRNLTRVMGSCTNQDFKAIVLEYMPNGSLEKWLYSENHSLNFMQRLNIMIDVASALEYLHNDCSTPVIHCDLKPGNVLIDENMVAHLSDFGIAKLLGEGESIKYTRTLATMGYMAPEYGSEGMVSTKCDVYSFSIMLLETFTRKRPSDEMFNESLNIKNWVKNSLPDALVGVIDTALINSEEEKLNEKQSCVCSILELALNNSSESPRERVGMKDVLIQLKKIKLQFEE